MLEKIRAIVFIVVLGGICTGFLVAADNFTGPKILRNQELKLKKKVLEACMLPYDDQNIDAVFNSSITQKEAGGRIFYLAKTGEIAFLVEGSGVWGPIRVLIAFKNDRTTIHGLSIVHQEETPGLGGRISEDEFLKSFSGRKMVPVLKITAAGKAAGENEVDGITGATMSVAALETILNNSLSILEQCK